MTEQRIDTLCAQMMAGLKQLDLLLDQEQIGKALQIHTDPEAVERRKQVKRLHRALSHYNDRDLDLFYIGFLGHFSSGKSSTINSLLRDHPEFVKRKADLNPTDEHITLLTHSDNRNKLLKMGRQGTVSVHPVFFEHDFLRHIVLIDTPGTGDPAIQEEIVRDALPLCDLILYAINMASPFDTSDIPLLSRQQKHLPDIPLQFIATRADEFERVQHKPLRGNFNENKFLETIAVTAARINETIGEDKFKATDFHPIDNKQAYGIETLHDLIRRHTDTESREGLLQLHGHKVAYFQRQSRELLDFFTHRITGKSVTVGKFLEQAGFNIERYQNKVRVGTDDLEKGWNGAFDKIKATVDGTEGKLRRDISTGQLPEKAWDIEALQNERRVAHSKIHGFRKAEADHLLTEFSTAFKKHLRQVSMETPFEIQPLSAEIVRKAQLGLPFSTGQSEPRAAKALRTFALTTVKELNKQLGSLEERLGTYKPIGNIEASIKGAEKKLKRIMTQFFEAIDMYKAAAMGNEVKEYIQELGLGAKLDAVDATDLKTDEIQDGIRKRMLMGLEPEKRAFKRECDTLVEAIGKLKGRLNEHSKNLENSRKVTEMPVEIFPDTDLQMQLEELLAEAAKEAHDAGKKEYQKRKTEAEKSYQDKRHLFLYDRRQKIRKWTLSALGIG
ncbi:MAG: GTPase, partial [Bacteroidota bacterium]